ncbi:MAG: helicase domain protein, partial [Solirubrobacterales bacterium]|nr:helicase domain protein [Solirubrobacterales bacterium]
IDEIGKWSRDEKREASKVMLQALAEKQIGRRDQANAWIWRLASYTREIHEEYAVARWPETKRLLGLLVNSSGAAHARNARRLIQATRKQDRRLSAAILAAALAHTPEAEEALRGARTRMARKPNALARDLLRNFPKGRRGRNRRRKKKGAEGDAPQVEGMLDDGDELDEDDIAVATPAPRRKRRRSGAKPGGGGNGPAALDEEAAAAAIREAAALLGGGATPDDEVEGPLFDTGDAWARDENAPDDDELDPDDEGIDSDDVEEFVEESDGLDLDDDGEPDLPDSDEVGAPDPEDVPDDGAHIGEEVAEAPKPKRKRAPAKKPATPRKKPAAKKAAADEAA